MSMMPSVPTPAAARATEVSEPVFGSAVSALELPAATTLEPPDWTRAGGDYYPKLLIAAPFTPVPGPRLLAHDERTARALIQTAERVVTRNGLSSAHANFVEPGQLDLFRDAGWLIREGQQFHWTNRGYPDFDAFLEDLWERTGLPRLTEAVAHPDARQHLRGGIAAASRMYGARQAARSTSSA